MARRERRAPVVFFEFRPAGFVPRYRCGLPHQPEKLVYLAGIDAAAKHSRRGRALVPRHNRTDRLRRNLFHLARSQRAARLARTADHFRDGRGHHDRAGRSRGSLFRQTASADGIPLRSDRIASRHIRVHGAQLSACPVGGLGFHRVRPLSGAGQSVPPARDLRMGAAAGWQAAAGDAGSRRKLVSLLQGRQHETRSRRGGPAPHHRQRRAPPVDGPREVEAGARRKNLRDTLSPAAR